MGALAGHLVAGLTFMFLGTRWLYCAFLRYFLCRREASLGGEGRRFRSSLVYAWSCCANQPVDGIVITAVAAAEFVGEFMLSIYDSVTYPWVMDITHMTMLFFIILVGSCIIAKHYKCMMVPNLDYYLWALAFFVQAFTIQTHVIGKSPLEAQVHTYASFMFAFIGVMTLVETYCRTDLLIAATRISAYLLLGSWMITLGFILYPQFGEEPWEKDSLPQMKLIMMIFLWNLAVDMVVATAIVTLVLWRVSCMRPRKVYSALATSSSKGISSCVREEYRTMLDFSDEQDV